MRNRQLSAISQRGEKFHKTGDLRDGGGDLGAFTPQIHFSYMAPWDWKRKGFSWLQIKDMLNEMRKAQKQALNYVWDNEHFYLDDLFGHPAIKFSIYSDGSGIGLWNARTNSNIGSFKSFPDDIEVWLTRYIPEGYNKCNDCGKWVKEWKHYSFAGAVCLSCYDPTRHLPPDTRGD